MATIFVRHRVKDFPTWKAAYDAFDAERRAMGVTDHGAYQTHGDPRDVTVYHHFESMDAARSFAESARLKEVMEAAGVEGVPELWFAERC